MTLSRSDISRRPFATRVSQSGLPDPAIYPIPAFDGCVMHFLTSSKSTSRYRVSTINFFFKCPVLLSVQGKRKNRVWQRTHRQGMMKKRLSIHSNGPCRFRTANIGALTSQHNIGFMLASIHTLLPPMGVFRNGEFLVTVERD